MFGLDRILVRILLFDATRVLINDEQRRSLLLPSLLGPLWNAATGVELL